MDETVDFDGCPYLYELEYTDEELFEIEERAGRESERERDGQRKTNQLLLKGSKFWETGGVPVGAVTQCPQRMNAFVLKRKLFNESIYVDIIVTDGVPLYFIVSHDSVDTLPITYLLTTLYAFWHVGQQQRISTPVYFGQTFGWFSRSASGPSFLSPLFDAIFL